MTEDKIIRGLLAKGTVNLIAISAKDMVSQAKKLHALSRVCTAALGRGLMMTSMMGVQLKGAGNRVTCIIKGGGPAGNIVCTGRYGGVVKGYIENPKLELPPALNGKLDVSGAVGRSGELVVIEDMGLKEPYIGRSEIVSGEIAEDFAHYYSLSEQQPSIVYLGVRLNAESGEVLSAGGVLVQPLPDCSEAVLDGLKESAQGITNLSRLLEKGKGLEDSLRDLFSGMDLSVSEIIRPLFNCDCNRERIERILISMGEEELKDMIAKEHGAELKCDFCTAVYRFAEDELTELLKSCHGDNRCALRGGDNGKAES